MLKSDFDFGIAWSPKNFFPAGVEVRSLPPEFNMYINGT
jgi:hypothetical protein